MKVKQRIIGAVVGCVCLASTALAFPVSADVLRGDVNGDGSIDVSDVVALK